MFNSLRRSHQDQNQNKVLSWPHLVGAQPLSLSSKPGKRSLLGMAGGGGGGDAWEPVESKR